MGRIAKLFVEPTTMTHGAKADLVLGLRLSYIHFQVSLMDWTRTRGTKEFLRLRNLSNLYRCKTILRTPRNTIYETVELIKRAISVPKD